jgi:hypothetical protein
VCGCFPLAAGAALVPEGPVGVVTAGAVADAVTPAIPGVGGGGVQEADVALGVVDVLIFHSVSPSQRPSMGSRQAPRSGLDSDHSRALASV